MNIAKSWLPYMATVLVLAAIPSGVQAQHRIRLFGLLQPPEARRPLVGTSPTAKRSPSRRVRQASHQQQVPPKPITAQKNVPSGRARGATHDVAPASGTTIVESPATVDGATTEIVGEGLQSDAFGVPVQNRWWAHGEYLMWWPRPMQVPALVTSGTTDSEGVLGADGTTTLVGDQMLDRKFSGGRVHLGWWTDPCAGRGWEVEFFGIGEETERHTFRGNGTTGSMVIARPFFNVLTSTAAPNGREDAELISFPDQIRGSVTVEATSRLYGIAVHPIWTNFETCGTDPIEPCCGSINRAMVTFIGWRYLNLGEGLRVNEDLTSLLSTPDDGQFLINDQFETRNRFNGADIGVLWKRRRDRFTLDFLMRVAIGSTRQDVTINGSTSVRNSQSDGNNFEGATGGLLAQRTNIGHYSRSQFSAVPELGVTLGYDLSPSWRFTVGYTLLYWSSVVRPGDQIDRDINPNLLPPEATPLAGLERPAFEFVETDLWVNGLNLGLQCRW